MRTAIRKEIETARKIEREKQEVIDKMKRQKDRKKGSEKD